MLIKGSILPVIMISAAILLISGCSAVGDADTVSMTTPKNIPAAAKTPKEETPVKCDENDLDCFIAAAKTCEKSSLTMNQSTDLGASIFTKIDRFEIRGGGKEKCTLYLKVIEWKSEPNQEWLKKMEESGEEPPLADENIEAQTKKRMADMIGSEGECIFPADKLAALFTRWKDQSYSSEDYKGFGCKGTYFVPENGFTENTLN